MPGIRVTTAQLLAHNECQKERRRLRDIPVCPFLFDHVVPFESRDELVEFASFSQDVKMQRYLSMVDRETNQVAKHLIDSADAGRQADLAELQHIYRLDCPVTAEKPKENKCL